MIVGDFLMIVEAQTVASPGFCQKEAETPELPINGAGVFEACTLSDCISRGETEAKQHFQRTMASFRTRWGAKPTK